MEAEQAYWRDIEKFREVEKVETRKQAAMLAEEVFEVETLC
jgi:hypothetical protein